MLENKALYKKAYEFSLAIVKVYNKLYDKPAGKVIFDELIRCGTGIGTNIAEANLAFSEAELLTNITTANKECMRAVYWLTLLKDSGSLEDGIFQDLFAKAEELSIMMFAVIKAKKLKK